MEYIRFLNIEYVFYQFYRFLKWFASVVYGLQDGTVTQDTKTIEQVTDIATTTQGESLISFINIHTLQTVRSILGIIVLAFVSLIFYSLLRWREEMNKQHHAYEHAFTGHDTHDEHETMATESIFKGDTQWGIVEKHLTSGNEAEMRLAILEADNMLYALLQESGFAGTSVGEILTGIDRSRFQTLEDAWEAHKVRNRIAHEGASFILGEREAKRIIGLYENVFREFKYIS